MREIATPLSYDLSDFGCVQIYGSTVKLLKAAQSWRNGFTLNQRLSGFRCVHNHGSENKLPKATSDERDGSIYESGQHCSYSLLVRILAQRPI